MSSCCKGTCSIQDIKKFDDLQYGIKKKICILTDSKLKNLYYGYGCEEDIDSKLNELGIYHNFFEDLKKAYSVSATSCMCDDNIQKIVEKTVRLTGVESCGDEDKVDRIIDESMLESYLLSNPGCASYNSWSEFSNKLCTIVGFTVTTERQKCDLTYDVLAKKISCDLLYDIKAFKEACDLGYTLTSSKKECTLEYNLLVKEKCAADLKKEDYIKLVTDYNLSPKLINRIYKENLKLTILHNKVYLKSDTSVYPLFSIAPSNLDYLFNLGFNVAGRDTTNNFVIA